jgi:hypothetical protein
MSVAAALQVPSDPVPIMQRMGVGIVPIGPEHSGSLLSQASEKIGF